MGNLNGNGKRANIRAVILDYGEVLCHAPVQEVVEQMAGILGIERQTFHQLYGKNRLKYDRGDLSFEQYWSLFAQDAGVELQGEQLKAIRQHDLEMWSSLNPTMLQWLADLRSAGKKTAILSNMPSDMVEHVQKNFAWMRDFDCRVFSADLGMVKPEPGIYQHCLRGLGVAASEALFIDDREANVEGARAVGIHSIRMQSLEQLRNDLRGMDFSPLPPEYPAQAECSSVVGTGPTAQAR